MTPPLSFQLGWPMVRTAAITSACWALTARVAHMRACQLVFDVGGVVLDEVELPQCERPILVGYACGLSDR